MALIRLYSQRGLRGDWSELHYDPAARTLTVIGGEFADALAPVAVGERWEWEADWEPWETPGAFSAYSAAGERLGETRPREARYERVHPDRAPSPGYGPTPSADEHDLDAVLRLLAPRQLDD